MWIPNLNAATATVDVAFLARGQANTSPASTSVTVAPGQTREFLEVFADPFHLDGVFGALRFRSAVPVAVTTRIFDANVHGGKGVGSAGQGLPGVPLQAAIGAGHGTQVAGLAQDPGGQTRSNFGLVEVLGGSCTVDVSLLTGDGSVLATKTYQMLPYEAMQAAVADLGGAAGTNRRVHVVVTAGAGAVVAVGSRIDNTIGDPTTMDMAGATVVSPEVMAGSWSGPYLNYTYGYAGSVQVTIGESTPARTWQFHLALTGPFVGWGGGPPPAQTLEGSIPEAGMWIASRTTSLFSAASLAIEPGGVITGHAGLIFNGGGVGAITILGHTDGHSMEMAYFIDHFPQVGGGEAVHATLTKS